MKKTQGVWVDEDVEEDAALTGEEGRVEPGVSRLSFWSGDAGGYDTLEKLGGIRPSNGDEATGRERRIA